MASDTTEGIVATIPVGHLPELRSGMRVLEVGTGNGSSVLQLAEWALKRGVILDVVGVDSYPTRREEFLRSAREKGIEHARFELANAFSLPVGLGRFDLLMCIGCFSLMVFSHNSTKLEALRTLVDRELDHEQQRAFLRKIRKLAPETITRRLCFDLLEHWRSFLLPGGTLLMQDVTRGSETPEQERAVTLFESLCHPLLTLSAITAALAASGYREPRTTPHVVFDCASREDATLVLGYFSSHEPGSADPPAPSDQPGMDQRYEFRGHWISVGTT